MNLTKDYHQKLQAWKSNISDIKKHDDGLKWVATHHKKIYKYIKDTYANKNTIKGHISVLAGILAKIDKFPRIRKKYSDESTTLFKELEDESKEQVLKPQRVANFICFEDIVKRMNEYKQLLLSDKTNNKYNLTWVLLSLYTFQPPIRMEYKNIEPVNNY